MRVLAVSLAAAVLGTGCDGTEMAARARNASDADKAAVEACRAAIASQMGLAAAEVAIRDVTRSEAGIGVRAAVDGAAAPWECMTDPRGLIAAVTFTGVVADN